LVRALTKLREMIVWLFGIGMPVLKFEEISAVSLRVRKMLAASIYEFAMLTSMPVPKIPCLAATAAGGGGGAPGPPGTGGGSMPPGGGTASPGAAGGGGGVFGAACAAFKSSSCF
jgi:hypothetical protein